MKTTVLAALAASLVLAPCASSAVAAETVRVALPATDLNAPAGRAEAVRRIRRAAADLCLGAPGALDRLNAEIERRACIDQATRDALARLPNPSQVASAAR